MATRPTVFAEFAREDQNTAALGGANIVEPSGDLKDSGWVWNTYPPAEVLNWIHRFNYLWDKYQESISNEADNHFRNQI